MRTLCFIILICLVPLARAGELSEYFRERAQGFRHLQFAPTIIQDWDLQRDERPLEYIRDTKFFADIDVYFEPGSPLEAYIRVRFNLKQGQPVLDFGTHEMSVIDSTTRDIVSDLQRLKGFELAENQPNVPLDSIFMASFSVLNVPYRLRTELVIPVSEFSQPSGRPFPSRIMLTYKDVNSDIAPVQYQKMIYGQALVTELNHQELGSVIEFLAATSDGCPELLMNQNPKSLPKPK